MNVGIGKGDALVQIIPDWLRSYVGSTKDQLMSGGGFVLEG